MVTSRRLGFDVGRRSSVAGPDLYPIRRVGPPTLLTSSLSASAGSYVEVTAATSAEYGGLLVTLTNTTSGSQSTANLVVATGAAGAETAVAIFAASSHGAGTTTGSTPQVNIPVSIPKGTRISVRVYGATSTVHVSAYPAAPGLPTKMDNIGMSFGFGTYVATSLSASSAWTQLIASTNAAYRGLIMVPGASTATMSAETGVTFTLGVGASGAEVSIGTCQVNTATTESMTMRIGTTIEPVMRHIPKGTRIAIKQTSAQTYFQGSVLGIPY